jgi:hypothetical protein
MPAVRIVDWPDMQHRMIQYDFARGQQANYCSGFCPTAPGIEEFRDDIYGELAEAFSNGDFIHTGLDESHQFGFCNRCQALQKEHGNAALLAQYVDNRVARSQAVPTEACGVDRPAAGARQIARHKCAKDRPQAAETAKTDDFH